MSSLEYGTLALIMRYVFLLLSALILLFIIVVSKREYSEKAALLGEVRHYVGYLEVREGMPEEAGKRIGIAASNVVGSGANADIEIDHESVAKSHARLYMKGGALVLRPYQKSKTAINGRRVVKEHAVRTGDTLTFGTISMKVFLRNDNQA